MKNIILCDDGEVQEVSTLCKKYGFGIEIQALHKPSLHEDKEQIELHEKCIKGIAPLSLHAPFGDLCPGSSDPMIREVTRHRFELAYRMAVRLGVSHIVFHIGYVPGTSWFDNYIKRFVDFWHEFLEGKSTDMSFYIENHLEHTPEMLSRVLTGINRKNVKACLDIGHAHCHSKVSVVERIKVLQDQIGYVHMHDNHGKEDEHLGLGQGNMSLVAVCKALEKYAPDAIWAPEAKAQWLQESIDRLKENKFL